jgi:AraC family transcriptional regulator
MLDGLEHWLRGADCLEPACTWLNNRADGDVRWSARMRQRQWHVPVTMGSPRFRTLEVTGCTVTEAWFPPYADLPPHTHDRPIFGVMLDGAFDSEIAHRTLDCPPGALWVEPLGERHSNRIGRDGARVLVVQPELAWFRPFAGFLDCVQHARHAGISRDAARIAFELTAADDLTPLIVDGLVHTMLATAARQERRRPHHSPPPRWLLVAQELVHARFRDRVSLSAIAQAVGISPSHLAREFHAHFGATVGGYMRRLRVEWVADQLTRTSMSLSELGIAAGFSDQSHLTREFRRQLGLTPAEWRGRGRGIEGSGVRGDVSKSLRAGIEGDG